MRSLRIIAVIGLLITSAFAADLANSFQQAAQLADVQEKAPATHDFSTKTLLLYYSQKYGPVMQSCFARVTQPDAGAFSFVAALGADGRVLRTYENQKTNISQCLLETVKADTFPAPPEAPYYFHVEMKFADPPPASSNGSSEGAPPLIVGANKYSYTFGVPSGWEFNFDQAHARGAALAYVPKGGSFNESASVIYVNEIEAACSDCLSPLSVSIAKTMKEVKTNSPSVEAVSAAPIVTKDGVRAAVRILKGSRDPRNPEIKDNEALAFIGHDETTILVVLSSRDAGTWERDYAAFRQIVSGHKFFTCSSPDLAVPCNK